jgi:hypothetical protein
MPSGGVHPIAIEKRFECQQWPEWAERKDLVWPEAACPLLRQQSGNADTDVAQVLRLDLGPCTIGRSAAGPSPRPNGMGE